MHAAGIVADHPAQSVVIVRRRVGTEGQVKFLGGIAQIVEHHAGLDPGGAVLRVDGQDVVQVFAVVDDDSGVAALAGEAGAAAARQHRRAVFPAQRHRRDHVLHAARHHDADRHLAVV